MAQAVRVKSVTAAVTEVEIGPIRGKSVTFQNIGSTTIYIGPTGVDTSTAGFDIPANGSLTLDDVNITTEAEKTGHGWFCIVAAGTEVLKILARS